MLDTQIKEFQNTLCDWFADDGKDYPWRRTEDPWHILVSEVMLQQTQVATVLNHGYYEKFLSKYPTPESIAFAPEKDILSVWEGLGYYRRVRNLQKAALSICNDHGGKFPEKFSDILDLPGIGRYTAGAVASFAYNQAQPIVDANVARVLSRLFNYHSRVDNGSGQKQLWKWANELLDQSQPKVFNSAIMELGQRICFNKSPDCLLCPVQKYCKAENPEELPIKLVRRKAVIIDEHCIFALKLSKIEGAHVLMSQVGAGERRAGMWTLPQRPIEDLENFDLLYEAKYAITHYKVTLRVYHCVHEPKLQVGEAWQSINTLNDIPVPSPFRKALDTNLKEYF